jgi:hypothetical protein
MDAMRRITHQGEPRIDVARRQQGRERIVPAPPQQANPAEMIAQPPGHLAGEGWRVQRREALAHVRAVGKDDRRDMRGARRRAHGKLREGSAGQEMLQRDVLVVTLMRDGANDAALAIGVADDRDTRLAPQWTLSPLGRDDETAGDALPGFGADHDPLRAPHDVDLSRGEEGNAAAGMQPPVQRDPQSPCLNHPAEGSAIQLGLIEMKE